ncbi:hypothetical protein BGP_0316 [Beggiatoa sp. PS]|nr:hypothetical protein BGP_0316 [Beggiatoa sp. PS]
MPQSLEEKPPAVLLVTAGRTDLQILVTDQNTQYPDMLPKYQVREFHQALLDKQVKYTVESPLKMEEPDKKHIRLKWKEGSLQPKEAVYQDDETIILVPTKLAETTQFLRENYRVRSVIIFNTHRGNSELIKQQLKDAWDEEPIALGFVLSNWLKNEFNIQSIGQQAGDIGLDKAGWVNILEGDMLKSGPGRDYPIHRNIIRKIDEILCSVANWEDNKLIACLATGGGLPESKEIIKASANYRFGYERVLEWQEVEYRNHEWVSPSKENTHPAESLRARDHASRLIRQGDFAGAYSAVKHLEKDDNENSWINKIKQVADYFAGIQSEESDALPDYLKVLVGSKIRCLLVGMRVEAALTTERLPEAIAWASTFLDTAMLDAIEKTQSINKLDEGKRLLVYQNKPNKDLTKQMLRTSEVCLKDLGGMHYEYNISGKARKQWLKIMQPDMSALKKYAQFFSENRGTDSSPRDLRNITVHQLMDVQLSNKVKRIFTTQKIWSIKILQSDYVYQSSDYFLKQPVVHGVLKQLGISDAANLYANLVTGLCQELAKYDFE